MAGWDVDATASDALAFPGSLSPVARAAPLFSSDGWRSFNNMGGFGSEDSGSSGDSGSGGGDSGGGGSW